MKRFSECAYIHIIMNMCKKKRKEERNQHERLVEFMNKSYEENSVVLSRRTDGQYNLAHSFHVNSLKEETHRTHSSSYKAQTHPCIFNPDGDATSLLGLVPMPLFLANVS